MSAAEEKYPRRRRPARKRFKDWAGYFFLKGTVAVVSRLPARVAWMMGGLLGTVAWTFWRGYRRLAHINVGIALGKELSPAQQRRLVLRSARSLAREFFEMFRWLRLPAEARRRLIEIEGSEHLARALQEGRGVIIISAHLSSFPLLSVALTLSGFPNAFVMRQLKVQQTDTYFNRLEQGLGVEIIDALPREHCVIQCLRQIKRNRTIIMALDLDDREGKVFVDFFGLKASNYTGPLVLGRRTGAPVIPAFLVRLPNRKHRCIIHPALSLAPSPGEKKEECLPALKSFNRLLEGYIRRYPEQWPWIYKRWRTRPPGEAPIYKKGY